MTKQIKVTVLKTLTISEDIEINHMELLNDYYAFKEIEDAAAVVDSEIIAIEGV